MTEIKLKKAVVHDGKTYDTLDIEEPSVGGVEAYSTAVKEGRSDMTAMIAMLAYESGWPVEVLRKMKSSDLIKISDAMAPFVPKEDGGPTGGPSSPTAPPSSTLQ